jgi:hypothetical protein
MVYYVDVAYRPLVSPARLHGIGLRRNVPSEACILLEWHYRLFPDRSVRQQQSNQADAPSILNASYNFKAEIEMPKARELALGAPQADDGMIVTQGGRFGGYGFYVLNRKPVFLYNFLDMQRVRSEGADALTPGKHTLEFDFKYDGLGAGTLAFNNVSGIGRGGTAIELKCQQLADEDRTVALAPRGLHFGSALLAHSSTSFSAIGATSRRH